MILIAVTGVIGSGKSTIAGILKSFGLPVIDADEISRKVTQKDGPAYKKIIETFGKEILKQDLEIDRKKLAQIVFNSPEKRKILENIIHPFVEEERKKIIKDITSKNPEAIIVLDIPLLFEAGLENSVDYIICAYADKEILYERVAKRDGMSKEEFLMRIKNQISLEEKAKKSHFVVNTNKSIDDLKSELFDIIKKINPNFVLP